MIEEFVPMVNTLLRDVIIRAPLAAWAGFQFLLISASNNALVVLNGPGDNAGMSGTPRRIDKERSASSRFSSLTGQYTTCRRHRNG